MLFRSVYSASGYGEVICEIKPEAMKRATVTGGNSLNFKSDVYGQPLNRPLDNNVVVGVGAKAAKTPKDLTRAMSPEEMFAATNEYVECQVSGGLDLEDIQRVSFTDKDAQRQSTKDMIRKFQKKGIEVVIRKW